MSFQDPALERNLAEQHEYKLEIESMDLGADVRAVGLELIERETSEPVTGQDAARIWAATLLAQAGEERWALDFFADVGRVRDFCRERGIAFREPNEHVIVIAPSPDQLESLVERFAEETFGMRAGAKLDAGDPAVEENLADSGVDAYQAAFRNYLFCAVCDFESGFLTLLSERLWASEVIRRARKALADLHVDVVRPV